MIKWRQLETCYYELRLADSVNESDGIESSISDSKQRFESALETDFNTSLALTEFFNMVKTINGLAADEKITKKMGSYIMPILEYMLDVLGLNVVKATDNEIKSVFELIQKREECRKSKQFDKADALRDEMLDMGIQLIDHTSKTLWIKKEAIKADI